MAKALYNNSPAWSEEDRNILVQMFHEGKSDEEIAEKLHRSAFAVGRQRCMLKLKYSTGPKDGKFELQGAISEYFPKWYKELLKKQWKEQRSISTR